MLEKQIKPSGGPKGINKKCVNLKNDPFLVQIILSVNRCAFCLHSHVCSNWGAPPISRINAYFDH